MSALSPASLRELKGQHLTSNTSLVLSRGGEKSQGGIWCHRREGWRLGGAHESQSRLGKGIEVGLLRLTGVGELLGIV